MLGELNNNEIEAILKRQVTGRIGCHADGVTYVVPLNFVYRNGAIYAHSSYGKKIEIMRRNPEVCFQVDELQSIFKWKSVIAWGRFEEIVDISEKEQAMQSLIHRIMPLVTTAAGHPSHGITDKESDVGSSVELIVYKINIHKLTGRFEDSN